MNLALAISCAKTIEALYQNDIGSNVVDPLSDTQVLVEKLSTGHFAVIFPGTASRRDWLTDVRIKKVDWGDEGVLSSRVHRGFASAYDSVRDGITRMLPPGVNLVIAGHSLGGALATLCAEDLNDLYPIDSVFTFGSPRVGNGPFARAYNAQLGDLTARLVNAGDPVPHLPWVFGTYRHVGTQHYLHRDGTLRVDQPLRTVVSEAAVSVDSVVDAPHHAFLGVNPHRITRYRIALESLPT